MFFYDKVSFKFFADDLKTYSTFNISSSYNNLQHALDLLVLWSESWQLSINLSKTQLLHLGTSFNVHTYLINGITILPADKVLDLGIITDSDLSYSSHISSIIFKARSRTGIIFRSFFSHNISLHRHAYITFVRLIIEYASQVWNPSVLKYISDFRKCSKELYLSYTLHKTLVLS